MRNKAAKARLGSLAGIVACLAFLEFTSGVIQGYYTPMLTDIARHLNIHDADVNWFEGTQLMLSALVVPALAKLGDMFGPRKMLLVSTALTALATLALPFANNFAFFLAAWTLQGFYVAWLPLEVAIIWGRSRGHENASLLTAKAAGILVAALESGAIVGALAGGALVDTLPLWVTLLVPAAMVIVSYLVLSFGISKETITESRQLDTLGLCLVSLALVTVTGGLSFLRLTGPAHPLPWIALAIGLILFIPFVRHELNHPDPLIDVRMFTSKSLSPVFITAGLFGVSVLGAQAPLSTFARTDPATTGYGLGAAGFQTSLLIGCYLLGMITGALLFPQLGKLATPRIALISAALTVGLGYALFVPLHNSYIQVLVNIVIAGIGSGALVAALPAAAAAAAPATQTGVATGLTNSVKTLGGAVSSAVFGLLLTGGVAAATSSSDTAGHTAGSYAGYITVWIICAATAFLAALFLLFVPKKAFTKEHVVADN